MSSARTRWLLAARPELLPAEELVRRMIKRAYAQGMITERRGSDSRTARRCGELVERDRAELLRRLRTEG
jgi:hypothetical protein